MNWRLLRTLVAIIISLAFVLNASTITVAQLRVPGAAAAVSEAVPPCHKMAMPDMTKAVASKPDTIKPDGGHDCCKKSPYGKAACVIDCCTSVSPYRFDVFRAVSFIRHRHAIVRVLPLHERICDPPSKPPSV